MIEDIYNELQNDIIKVFNFDINIVNNDFRKINIYYDENINSNYYNYIKNIFNNEKINNSYVFRTRNIRYIMNDYFDIIKYKLNLLDNIKNNNHKLLKKNLISNEDLNNVKYNNTDKGDDNNKNNIKNNEFDKLYFNNDKQRYICQKCNSEYRSKYMLIRHFLNKKMCEYKQKVKELINYSSIINNKN